MHSTKFIAKKFIRGVGNAFWLGEGGGRGGEGGTCPQCWWWKCTYASRLLIGCWLCAFIGNANHMRAVFTSGCVSLLSIKLWMQSGKIRTLLRKFRSRKRIYWLTESSAISNIPLHTSTLPGLPDPPFRFLRGPGDETTPEVGLTRKSSHMVVVPCTNTEVKMEP